MPRSDVVGRVPVRADQPRRPLKEVCDADVLDRCARGDAGAWDEVITRYGRLVYSIPRRYGFDTATSEDVFQEVFGALARQLPKIRNHDALKSWLLTTTRRVCHRTVGKMRQSGVPLPEIVDDGGEDPLVVAERQHRVREALRQLGGPCETLLRALFLQSDPVSYDEVARVLGMPRGSIGPTRARCLMKLLEIFNREAGDRET